MSRWMRRLRRYLGWPYVRSASVPVNWKRWEGRGSIRSVDNARNLVQTYFLEDKHFPEDKQNPAHDLWGVVRKFLPYMAGGLWYRQERRAEGKGEGRVSETSTE